MAKSPFSSAGGGDADTHPHSTAARKHGGAVKHRAEGGSMDAETMKEAKGKKSIGDIDKDGENVKPRLDRKNGGGCGRKDGGKWIAGAIKRPGALHKATGTPQGEKIPAKKLAKAEHSSNPRIKKEANLAKTLKGFHKE